MTDSDNASLHSEIRKVGQKVDSLQLAHETDRNFLKQLHSDHLMLGGRVKASEDHIVKTQAALQSHIEVACVIQESTRKEISETKDMLKGHIAQEDIDRREVIKHLRESNIRVKNEGRTVLMWAVGLSVSVVVTLFGLLWATGTIGP